MRERDRLYASILRAHLSQERQMAFLAGPRQVGTTTACRRLADTYLDRDSRDHREAILRGPRAVAGYAGLELLGKRPPVLVLDQLVSLASLLARRSGDQLVYSSLARDIRVAENTVRNWIGVLSGLHDGFLVRPWYSSVTRALRKEPRGTLRDWSGLQDEGRRAETMCACHLLKAVEGWTDLGLGAFELAYVRDKERREADFLVVRDGAPWFLVEAKHADSRLSPALGCMQRQIRCPHAFQMVVETPYVNRDCFAVSDPVVVPGGSIDAGSAEVNVGKDVVFTVANAGDEELVLPEAAVSTAGEEALQFVVTEQPASSVAVGGDTSFTIRFTPTSAGQKSVSVEVASDDPDLSTYGFDLQGTGTVVPAPSVIVSQGGRWIESGSGSCSFGETVLGVPVDPSFTLENGGTADLTLGSGWLTVSGAPYAAYPSPSPTVIIPEDSLTFTIRFDPAVAGVRPGTVGIASDDPVNDPYTFSLTGRGVTPAAVLTVRQGTETVGYGGSATVGTVAPGKSKSTEFVIGNDGNVDLELTGATPVTVSGGDSGMFEVTAQPTSPVAAGGSSAFTIRYSPTTEGEKSTTVSIASNDAEHTVFEFTIGGTSVAMVAVLRTGQETCYATGDDGDLQIGYEWSLDRFTTANEGATVRDSLTGLEWVSDGALMATEYPELDDWDVSGDGLVEWSTALLYVDHLNSVEYLGYSDWRLPNRVEIKSLIDYSAPNRLAWLQARGFSYFPVSYYWSSSTAIYDDTSAWVVDFASSPLWRAAVRQGGRKRVRCTTGKDVG